MSDKIGNIDVLYWRLRFWKGLLLGLWKHCIWHFDADCDDVDEDGATGMIRVKLVTGLINEIVWSANKSDTKKNNDAIINILKNRLNS